MIPSNLTFNNSPSSDPQPMNQQVTPQNQPEPQQIPQPEPSQTDYSSRIISEDAFFDDYQYDTKIAADAVMNEETGIPEIDPALSAAKDAPPQISPELARRNTETLINMRDMVQSSGLAWYVDGSIQEYQKYQYDKAQKSQLVEAWLPIVQQANLQVSPWMGVIVAEAMCTGPLLGLAYTARKQRQELAEMREKIQRQEAKISKMEQQESFAKPERSPESQKKWAVDNRGYFTHTPSGVYLKQENRHEKPNLQRDYDLLIKHNGKEQIHKVFKID